MKIDEVKNKFKRLVLEYTSIGTNVDEDGDEQNPMMDDPTAIGDPNAMGGEPQNMMDSDPNAMGNSGQSTTPQQPPQGFEPQGIDQNVGIEGMGGDQSTMQMDQNANFDGKNEMNAEQPGPEDDVIEIDDLTNSQEDTEKKVDELSSKFEKVLHSIDKIEQRISDIDDHTNRYLDSLKSEIEKRNPTPMQRLTMRSTKSAPYSMTPNEYMENYAPENYSDESDNNGADDPQYKITKGDIDDFVDYNSIAKEIANNKVGLKDIFGY